MLNDVRTTLNCIMDMVQAQYSSIKFQLSPFPLKKSFSHNNCRITYVYSLIAHECIVLHPSGDMNKQQTAKSNLLMELSRKALVHNDKFDIER